MSAPVERTRPRDRPDWLKQTGVVALGVLLAAAMVVLGVWQLDVYQRQGEDAAQRRAAEPAGGPDGGRPARRGGRRRVRALGHLPGTYDAGPAGPRPHRRRLPGADGAAPGGRQRVAVVRGSENRARLPRPPTGTVTRTGVLLPSEETSEPRRCCPQGQIAAVRLPTLAQTWPSPLVNGFVTLDAGGRRPRGSARAGRPPRGPGPPAERRVRPPVVGVRRLRARHEHPRGPRHRPARGTRPRGLRRGSPLGCRRRLGACATR